MDKAIAGAEVMASTGVPPLEFLLVTKPPDPVWPPAVCATCTATAPSGKPLTSMPAVDQAPPLHRAVAEMVPTSTVTLAPSTEQVPDTV